MEYLRGLPKAELAKRHQALKNFVAIGDSLFGSRVLAEIESQAAQEWPGRRPVYGTPPTPSMLPSFALKIRTGRLWPEPQEITRPAALGPLADKVPATDPYHGPRPAENKDRRPAGKDLENTPEEEREQPAMNSSTTPSYEQACLEHRKNCWQKVR